MKKTVAIIGNGEIRAGLAPVIDHANLVIRFNDCRSAGAGGTKTDIVAVCNTGRPAKAMTEGTNWKTNPSVIEAQSIWLVRDAPMFAAMRAPLQLSHPELDDFCDDYSEGYKTFARQTGKDIHVIPAATHKDLDLALSAFAPEPYVVPSSGLIVIFEVLRQFEHDDVDIMLAGFGHQGWEWHPFAAERRFVDDLAAKGRLRRLTRPDLDVPSQGA